MDTLCDVEWNKGPCSIWFPFCSPMFVPTFPLYQQVVSSLAMNGCKDQRLSTLPCLPPVKERCKLITSWTWEHYNIGWLCPKMSPDTDLPLQLSRKIGRRKTVPLTWPIRHSMLVWWPPSPANHMGDHLASTMRWLRRATSHVHWARER